MSEAPANLFWAAGTFVSAGLLLYGAGLCVWIWLVEKPAFQQAMALLAMHDSGRPVRPAAD